MNPAHAIARVTVLSISIAFSGSAIAGGLPATVTARQDAPKQAPKQEAPKQDSPKQAPKPDAPNYEIDVPKEPLVPGVPGQAPAKPEKGRVSDAIDPKAEAIVLRAMQLIMDLRTISMVTKTRAEGDAAVNLPPGFGEPHEVTLEYPYKDALSLPRMRVSPVSSAGVVVFTHSGTEALVVDNGAKIYRKGRSDWPKIAPFVLTALPAWLVSERQMAITAKKQAPDAPLKPDMSMASMLGTETLDGTECDVVKMVRYLDVYAEDTGQGKPGIVDAKRMVFEIAFARTDGFPRRVIRYEEGTASSGRVTTEFTKVRVNPTLDASTFSATTPEGYALAPAADGAPPKKTDTK